MRPKKNRAAEVLDAPKAAQESTTSKVNPTGNSASAQRLRILDHLQRFGPATSIELRGNLDVLNPQARIWELRHRLGYNIQKAMVYQFTECGKLHLVAKYFLVRGE